MDMNFILCVTAGAFIIAFFIFLIYLSVKRNACGELPPMDMNYLYYNLQMQGQARGWSVNITPMSNKVHISKGSLVGTEMYFIQRPDGRISMFYVADTGPLGWVIVIVMLGTLLGAFIIAVWLHIESGKFTRNEVIPAIAPVPAPVPAAPLY
jgi:hypothetical protein